MAKKWLFANEISVFINRQYFIDSLTLIFGMQIGMNERNKVYKWIFSKNSRFGKWAILGPKMAHLHNSESAVIIVLKFSTIKGDNRQMKLMIFQKKSCLEQMDHFGSKNGVNSQLLICCKNFFKILHNKSGQQVDEININDFY